MKNVPRFLSITFRKAFRVALQEQLQCRNAGRSGDGSCSFLYQRMLLHRQPVLFALDEDLFHYHMSVAMKGAAGCPSGMTAKHLRSLMSPRHENVLQVERLGRGEVPDIIIQTVGMGPIIRLRKAGAGCC